MKSRKAFPLRIDPVLYEELEAWRSRNSAVSMARSNSCCARRSRNAARLVTPSHHQVLYKIVPLRNRSHGLSKLLFRPALACKAFAA